jgi:DNA-binding Xre family transcriptional regulator
VRRLVINWELVEQRRITAGLTHTQLAERVGAAAVTGPVRLWQDCGHDAVPLGLLERLCQVLDLHPVELFRAPPRAAQCRTVAVLEVAADEQVLEAPPTGRGHRRPRRHLGRPRCPARRGRHRARPRDARPGASSWAAHPAQRQALHRLVDADEGLDVDTVRVLYAAAAPELRCTERHRAISAAAALRLQQLGLVRRRHRAQDLELTDDARYALLLDAVTRPSTH